jgi:hypothetical protein
VINPMIKYMRMQVKHTHFLLLTLPQPVLAQIPHVRKLLLQDLEFFEEGDDAAIMNRTESYSIGSLQEAVEADESVTNEQSLSTTNQGEGVDMDVLSKN